MDLLDLLYERHAYKNQSIEATDPQLVLLLNTDLNSVFSGFYHKETYAVLYKIKKIVL